MTRCIVLLRGINVGGKNSLPMKEFRRLLESEGLEDVATYIQSGNAVARSSAGLPPDLSERIRSAIETDHGFRAEVLVLSEAQLQRAIEANPYPEAEDNPRAVHLFFLASRCSAPDMASLERTRAPSEQFQLTDRVFYLYAPDGFGRSKLAAKVEKSLGVPMTARNWRTVLKLRDMITAL